MLLQNIVARGQDAGDTPSASAPASTTSSNDRMERLLSRVDPGSAWFANSPASPAGAEDSVEPLRYLPI